MTSKISVLMFGIAICLLYPAMGFTEQAGRIIRIKGTGTISDDRKKRPMLLDVKINEGEKLVTGIGARVSIQMVDKSIIILGENTELIVQTYRFDAKKWQGKGLLEITRGAFRATTGNLGKMEAPRFRIRTPLAVIGVRGTDFWGGLHFFDAALDVALLGGRGIIVENDQGRVEISEPGVGTTIQDEHHAPSHPVQWDTEKVSQAKASVSY